MPGPVLHRHVTCMGGGGSGEVRVKLFKGSVTLVGRKSATNSLFDEAQKIELNVSVEGLIKNEDVDYFAVDLTAGVRS